MFETTAYAMGTGAAPGGQPQGSFIDVIIPFALIFGIFYFVLIRPQQKKNKEHQGFVSGLKKGDMVVTSSGIIGKIYGITDKFINLEIADNVRIKILRESIAGPRVDEETEKK